MTEKEKEELVLETIDLCIGLEGSASFDMMKKIQPKLVPTPEFHPWVVSTLMKLLDTKVLEWASLGGLKRKSK
ncbi:hypothetical protein C4577_04235 [Candidatus Parcubacteria bacterium]|nr:MAG: hypothetical protein C4577_04235 [Candidatus Parcubacteria bacterium]